MKKALLHSWIFALLCSGITIFASCESMSTYSGSSSSNVSSTYEQDVARLKAKRDIIVDYDELLKESLSSYFDDDDIDAIFAQFFTELTEEEKAQITDEELEQAKAELIAENEKEMAKKRAELAKSVPDLFPAVPKLIIVSGSKADNDNEFKEYLEKMKNQKYLKGSRGASYSKMNTECTEEDFLLDVAIIRKKHNEEYAICRISSSSSGDFYFYEAYFLKSITPSNKIQYLLGLDVKELDYEDRLRLSRNTGVVITNVYENSPAFFANLSVDHIITAVNGKTVNNYEDWNRETENIEIGVPIKVTLARMGHDESFFGVITPKPLPLPEKKLMPQMKKVPIGTDKDMVFVEGGSFYMGMNEETHMETVKDFYMCNHEVTQAEWERVMGKNPCYWQGKEFDAEYQPAENITWKEAIAYCNARSRMEGLTPCYSGSVCNFSANGYRLPTEAEWEYAAKGGKGGSDIYAGTNTYYKDEVAWSNENSGGIPQPVMQKKPNRLGLYDLTGNVSEFCNSKDSYGHHIVKGGDARKVFSVDLSLNDNIWDSNKKVNREKSPYMGFRVVRSK